MASVLKVDTIQNAAGTSGAALLGTNTNDSAALGYVGERVVTSNSGANSFAGSTVYGGDHAIALTAGDWDVSFVVEFDKSGATTMTQADAFVGSDPGDNTTGRTQGDNYGILVFTSGSITNGTLTIPSYRLSLSGSSTYYLKTRAVYTGTAPIYRYRISARRVR